MKIPRRVTLLTDKWLGNRHARRMSSAATMTPAQCREERVRYWVAAILVFFFILMLMEVIIAPGSMIRRHLHQSDGGGTQVDTKSVSLRLHEERLRALYDQVHADWMSFRVDVKHRLGIDIDTIDAKSPPVPENVDSVAAEAWKDICQTSPDVSRQLSGIRPSVGDKAARVDPGPSLGTEDDTCLAAIDRLEQTQRSLERMRAELDHIELALRSQAQPPTARQ